MNGRLGIGFVGGGFITRFHVQSFVGVREADVRGVWSPNRESAEGVARLARDLDVGECRAYGSITDMVADPAIDAVWICGPNHARIENVEEVVHAIESHHGEVEQRTIEAVLAQAADAISGSRPGARRESIEQYVKRLQRLEEICESHPGVGKVFAMQAGREVRVMVTPEEVDDLAAQVLARDIAKQVEEELQYPGQIKITVVRETRAVEVAK